MLFSILGVLSLITDVLPLILLLKNRKLLHYAPFRALLGWTIFSVLSDIMIIIVSDKHDQSVAFVSIIVEVVFACALYYVVSERKQFKRLFGAIGTIYTLFSIIYFSLLPPVGFVYWFGALSVLLVLVLSFVLLFELFMAATGVFLLRNPYVWFPLAYMIYCSGNIFLFASSEYFPDIFSTGDNGQDGTAWSIFLVANIFKNVLFLKSMQLASKTWVNKQKNRLLAATG
ncbi:MAG: hypothetical protein JNM68_08990 [Dinghuibacter sp.]|nr:hypothetical protein [Dinghuibacter sp.]